MKGCKKIFVLHTCSGEIGQQKQVGGEDLSYVSNRYNWYLKYVCNRPKQSAVILILLLLLKGLLYEIDSLFFHKCKIQGLTIDRG